MASQPILAVAGIEAHRGSSLYVTPAALPAELVQQTSNQLFGTLRLWADKTARAEMQERVHVIYDNVVGVMGTPNFIQVLRHANDRVTALGGKRRLAHHLQEPMTYLDRGSGSIPIGMKLAGWPSPSCRAPSCSSLGVAEAPVPPALPPPPALPHPRHIHMRICIGGRGVLDKGRGKVWNPHFPGTWTQRAL